MKNKKTIFATLFALSIMTTGLLIANANEVMAAGYTPMPITGVRNIKVSYDADDIVSNTPYAGALRQEVCADCKGRTPESDPKKWEKLQYASNGQVITAAVQDDTFGMASFQLPNVEGEHVVCVRVMDNAIHGQSNDYGNVSDQKCTKVYYDKSAPVITDVVINNGNKFANHGEIPVTFTVTDNRAGILSGITGAGGQGRITYNNGYGGVYEIEADEITCKKSTNPVEGDGSEVCKVNATLHLNSDIDYLDIVFTPYDNVNNNAGYTQYPDNTPYRIYFDKIAPTIDIKVPLGEGGTINTNTAVVEYHVKDDIADPWLHASGLQKVTLSNGNGANEKTILINPDFTQDMEPTLDGIIRDYILENCPNGSVKMEAWDRAGNHSVEIFDNDGRGIKCETFVIENVRVDDVVNPKIYNTATPFEPVSFNAEGKMEPLPKGLAGANVDFTINYRWEGDTLNKIYGNYTITVKDQAGTYNKKMTNSIKAEEVSQVATGIYASSHTIKLPTDAPVSTPTNKVYVYIYIEATVETVEGDVIRYGGDTYPDIGEGIMVEIVGSIEDYLWFGEIN